MKTFKTGLVIALLTIIASCTQQNPDEGGNRIPYTLEEWKGVQAKTLADSKPDFVGPVKAKKGSPNVLVIMLDDAGYSNAGSYGGAMKTPTFDKIGDEGIRYTHMSVAAKLGMKEFVTPICR